ncbi:MAG: hypothetical protein ACHQ4J_14460 [Candidatus Binatia bacterium]
MKLLGSRSMSNGDIAFIILAINPLGGLLLAIPMAMLTLQYPLWLAVVSGVPLAYVQVTVVDAAWTQLMRLRWWRRLLERRRSPRIERLMASRGAFWPIVALTPLIGPWAIMAFMRYAHVPQRHVTLPILLGLTWIAMAIAVACVVVPESMQAVR